MARIRSADEVSRRPAGPIRCPPGNPRRVIARGAARRRSAADRLAAGSRACGRGPVCRGGRLGGRLGRRLGRRRQRRRRRRRTRARCRGYRPDARGAGRPDRTRRGGRARVWAAPAGLEAGAGARTGAEASTWGLAPATVRCGPAGAAPGFGTAGAGPAAPGRTAPAGLRLTTTVRRGFLTTTMRRRSLTSAGGRAPCPAPPGDAGAAPAGRSSARGAAGATTVCSGLRLIRVARGRGFSSVSGRSEEGLGDAVVFSSLILSKSNSRAVRIVGAAAA